MAKIILKDGKPVGLELDDQEVRSALAKYAIEILYPKNIAAAPLLSTPFCVSESSANVEIEWDEIRCCLRGATIKNYS